MDFTQMRFFIQTLLHHTLKSKHWEKLDKVGLVGINRLQGENDCNEGGICYGLFVAPKIKHCLIEKKIGIIDEHKFSKVLQIRLLI